MYDMIYLTLYVVFELLHLGPGGVADLSPNALADFSPLRRGSGAHPVLRLER